MTSGRMGTELGRKRKGVVGGWVGRREREGARVSEVKVKVEAGRKVITLLKLMAKVDERGTR